MHKLVECGGGEVSNKRGEKRRKTNACATMASNNTDRQDTHNKFPPIQDRLREQASCSARKALGKSCRSSGNKKEKIQSSGSMRPSEMRRKEMCLARIPYIKLHPSFSSLPGLRAAAGPPYSKVPRPSPAKSSHDDLEDGGPVTEALRAADGAAVSASE